MKKLSCLLLVLSFVLLAGCQQGQQEQTSSLSRKDRLVVNENLRLQDELANRDAKIADLLAQIEKCQKEKEQTAEDTAQMMDFLMKQVPTQLTADVKRLTEENQKLTTEIEKLKAQK